MPCPILSHAKRLFQHQVSPDSLVYESLNTWMQVSKLLMSTCWISLMHKIWQASGYRERLHGVWNVRIVEKDIPAAHNEIKPKIQIKCPKKSVTAKRCGDHYPWQAWHHKWIQMDASGCLHKWLVLWLTRFCLANSKWVTQVSGGLKIGNEPCFVLLLL